MLNKALFSSNSDEWETPTKLFDELNQEFHFEFDLAATAENAKCRKFFTKSDNALIQSWQLCFPLFTESYLWCNPPYSSIKQWVEKAYRQTKYGVKTVMLIPARTDTRWFHSYIYKNPNVEIRFIKGRLKFSNSKNSAPFPSMICVFR